MKISKSQLRQIIKEELSTVRENEDEDFLDVDPDGPDAPPQLSPAELGARIITDDLVSGKWLVAALDQSGIYDLDSAAAAAGIKHILRAAATITNPQDQPAAIEVLKRLAKEVFRIRLG